MKLKTIDSISNSVTNLHNWFDCIGYEHVKTLDAIVSACTVSQQNGGMIRFTGVGKNVHCCEKLTHTADCLSLQSTFFDAVHAMHGDMGSIRSNDVIIAFSKTGNTQELATAMTYLQDHKEQLAPNVVIIGINFAGGKGTMMHDWADILLSLPEIQEDTRNPRIPTNSLIASQIIGDAIVLQIAEELGVDFERFKLCHPGGGIGLQYKADK